MKRLLGLVIETAFAALLVSPFVILAGAAAPVSLPEPQEAPVVRLLGATSTVPATLTPEAATVAPVPLPMPDWGQPELAPATAGQEPLQEQRDVMGQEPLSTSTTTDTTTTTASDCDA